MKEIIIGVIDNGIDVNLYNIGNLYHNIQITEERCVEVRASCDHGLSYHGTTCAAIIKKYAPKAILSSVKILDDTTDKGDRYALIDALKWCICNNITLINLSLGTIDFRDFKFVKAAVDSAIAKGIVIVAACNNRNVFACPASLPEIIGVNCDISGILKKVNMYFMTIP